MLRVRRGFTILEVLIAATVLSIALMGITAAGFNAVKKASTPSQVENAAMLAAERLAYFRSQKNPYLAVGGSYYNPPVLKSDPDMNTSPEGDKVNIRLQQNGAYLFVREFLQGSSENADAGAGISQAQRFGPVSLGTGNDIPETPVNSSGTPPHTYDGVLPADDSQPQTTPLAETSVLKTATGVSATASASIYRDYYFVTAPRAHGQDIYQGQAIDQSYRFVREVWVQTSHPAYPTNAAGGLMLPGGVTPPGLAATFGVTGTDVPVQATLPVFTVAVTVRVYARDPKITKFSTPGAGMPGQGIGYDPKRALAQMVGYFGLNNRF